MDSTQDITKVDQVSIIIRYVIIDHEKHVLQVKESFIGFYKIDQHGAQEYENLIYKVLSDTNLDIKKCKGQGYDGASVMKGMYSGVQKRIIDKAPNATYVHCCAHNLNLVICDAAKSSSDALRFFETIQSKFNFFSSSAPRWALLAFGNETNDIRKKTLKKLCPTRWEARHKSLFALKERFVDVLKSLSMIFLTSHKSEEKIENILRSTQCVSKMLQSQKMNIQSACTFLDQAYQLISNLRNNFKDILNTAELICSKWNIPTDFKTKRQAFAKYYFNEVDGDRLLFQICRRFEGLYEVASTFSFLNPSSLKENNEADIIKASYDFAVKYDIDISSDFTRQVLSFKSIINQIELPNILSMIGDQHFGLGKTKHFYGRTNY
ncbi:zinc finger MYM-type protein 1-like [Melanaphis sacchari]|uniref:zinc finger MYM-type protein 1-like n=1 Tax=Melanaphis sacchari TaxID=742174 RepID=UPI000DC15550|nr:zinc finger MYM-type protein 1-like [Melanaphis sacchari]